VQKHCSVFTLPLPLSLISLFIVFPGRLCPIYCIGPTIVPLHECPVCCADGDGRISSGSGNLYRCAICTVLQMEQKVTEVTRDRRNACTVRVLRSSAHAAITTRTSSVTLWSSKMLVYLLRQVFLTFAVITSTVGQIPPRQ